MRKYISVMLYIASTIMFVMFFIKSSLFYMMIGGLALCFGGAVSAAGEEKHNSKADN